MFDITGFNKFKLYLSATITSLLSTAVAILLLSFLPIKTHWLYSTFILFPILLFSHFYLLLSFSKNLKKHFNIIRNIMDAISDVIVIKNFEGNFVFCNKTTATLYNSQPEDMVGKDDYYFTKNKEQNDFFRENVQSIMRRNEKEEVYESSTDAATGEVRHFLSTKIPYRDVLGNSKIVVIAKDVTDITRLKEEADRNKKRLEHVLDVSEEGLWEWNTQTNQVLHNKRWELITGIERSDNSFAEFESCILPEDRPVVKQALGALMQENKPYSIKFRMKRPDGAVIWVWDRGRVAEYDQDNNPIWLAGIALDITTEKLNQEKIENLAYYDQLTGLLNRNQLETEFAEVINKSALNNHYSVVLFLDLDRFKLLNDSYGHYMGDKLLKIVANRLKNIDVENALISRFGGDEFIVVLPLMAENQNKAAFKAQEYAETVLTEIAKVVHIKDDLQDIDIEYAITASIGGVMFKSAEETTGKLLQLADIALYRVKSSGGHAAMIFDIDKQDELKHTSELRQALHSSVNNEEFCIYLQAKYSPDEKVIGAEALIRWNHPARGVLTPAAFIDIAEESNLIIPMGASVLRQACQQLKKWQSNPETAHLTISVNLSAKQIWQSQFVEEFIAIIEPYQIDHSKLILEVTESVLIQDINDATEKLSRFKEYGVSISLDDFGTGYSSLSYLRSLPIDELKIDGSFIQNITEDRHELLMVKSIIELAKNFNLTIVTEGVEEKAQFDLLTKYDVNSYQGYYFSKPLPVNEFDALLSTQEG